MTHAQWAEWQNRLNALIPCPCLECVPEPEEAEEDVPDQEDADDWTDAENEADGDSSDGSDM